jgi:hypothetical protein
MPSDVALAVASSALPRAVVLALLATASVAAQEPTPAPIVIRTATVPGVELRFLSLPWGPETLAMMERGEESYYTKRTWPFARLTTSVPMALDGTALAPGNYALVLHPNDPSNRGLSLEVLKIAPGEFLQQGNPLTRTPPGQSVYKAPVRFETAERNATVLDVELEPSADAVLIRVHYGNRILEKELSRKR